MYFCPQLPRLPQKALAKGDSPRFPQTSAATKQVCLPKLALQIEKGQNQESEHSKICKSAVAGRS